MSICGRKTLHWSGHGRMVSIVTRAGRTTSLLITAIIGVGGTTTNGRVDRPLGKRHWSLHNGRGPSPRAPGRAFPVIRYNRKQTDQLTT
ncbi:Small ribosomal subunit biogenesis GTPase RsgA [Trichinella spiralis]|uniref:Small ribosomal subunit biogenesis GTPase RsgA n=1 Tax=Trichinella spiralis TaxID=6334 RepID=A0ABR3KFW6_TRISP